MLKKIYCWVCKWSHRDTASNSAGARLCPQDQPQRVQLQWQRRNQFPAPVERSDIAAPGTGALRRRRIFPPLLLQATRCGWSFRHSRAAGFLDEVSDYVRPHPGPLPQERGNVLSLKRIRSRGFGGARSGTWRQRIGRLNKCKPDVKFYLVLVIDPATAGLDFGAGSLKFSPGGGHRIR
jgi:hypothetical protein